MKCAALARLFGAALAALPFALLAHKPDQAVSAPARMPVQFTDVAARAGLTLLNLAGGARKGYLLEVAGNGAAWLDYNNDGRLDLLIVNGSKIARLPAGGDPLAALYRNDGHGKFTDVTAPLGLAARGWGSGVCVADFDNDGFDDLYITAYTANVLYRNAAGAKFENVTARARVGDSRWSTGCAFGDFDRDGDVDLYVSNYVAMPIEKTPTRGVGPFCNFMGMDSLCGPRGLPGAPDALYRNNGDGAFTDVTAAAGIRDPGHYGFAVLFTDLDNDGWPDIYVANDSVPNFLWRNNRDGTFTDIALEAGVALSEEGRAQAGMGVEAGDYDADGWLDLFVTNFSHDTHTLYRNRGGATFTVETHRAGLGHNTLYLGWGAGFVDFDNDGWLDLLAANGHIYPEIDRSSLGASFREPILLYHNLGNGRFADITAKIGGELAKPRSARGVAFGDYDDDGDTDMLVVQLDERPALLRNDGAHGHHWIKLKLTGAKSNRNAIGARVRLEAGGRAQFAEVRSGSSYISQNDMRLNFGLGKAPVADHIEVRWPSGLVQSFANLQADQAYLVVEGKEPAPLPRPHPRPSFPASLELHWIAEPGSQAGAHAAVVARGDWPHWLAWGTAVAFTMAAFVLAIRGRL